MIIVTIADARMFAKLLPINIDESRISGLCSNFKALFESIEREQQKRGTL